MYSRIITEEIVRLQANGFTIKETQDYLQEHYSIRPHRNTVHNHRHSPIGVEMLQELIRHQERSILKADSDKPALAMKYRADLIGKMMDKLMPTKIESYQKMDVTERREVAIDFGTLAPAERKLIESVARRYIKANNTAESASLH